MPMTTAGQEAAIKQHADDPFLWRLTVTDPTLAEPIRVVRNRENIVTTDPPALEFLAYPFEIEPPSDNDEQPRARISISNVDREIIRELERMVEPADFKVELFLASDPDTVEKRWTGMSMTQAQGNYNTVTMTIQRISYWDEPFPRHSLTPRDFPGMTP